MSDRIDRHRGHTLTVTHNPEIGRQPFAAVASGRDRETGASIRENLSREQAEQFLGEMFDVAMGRVPCAVLIGQPPHPDEHAGELVDGA